jgi:cyclopropane fatty-acyl-phospholipid synthase-like methyltransferase
MNEQEKIQFFYEIFDSSLLRLAPGDDTSTKKALNTLFLEKSKHKNALDLTKLKILDIGCGNGAQTIQLVKYTKGTVIAVDNHQPFLDELQRRAEAEGIAEKIQPCLKDMCALEMEKGIFDLIWSEGSLYIMGFYEGLATCRDLLVPNGLLAVSELSWFRSDPPEECRQFFADEYPAMVDMATNLATIKNSGFKVLGHFTLPESTWWISYYQPLENRLQLLREKYVTDPIKIKMIESVQMEIEVYRKYSKYYGYVFYLMQRS